ncbi:alanine racemase [candidate division KSB1 bacterium]|nr:alanine racemase [candidate division KSB1 bacterium]
MRPTHVEIDLSNIAYNLDQIKRKVSPAKIMAVVKANAYGHGAVEVAVTALKSGASYLAVALIEEGLELRNAGITAPILVFGGELEYQIDDFLKAGLHITICSKKFAEVLSREALKHNCRMAAHVKVDTGMGRVGVPWQDALDFICDIHTLEGLEVKGIYTHFATSDERDKTFALSQLNRFHQVLEWLRQHSIRIPMVHAANSGAIIDIPHSYFNIVRPGIMMYGYYPSNETSESVPIKPAMTFKSKISYIKDVPKGTPLSYGRTYITKKASRIATIPVGYADGYNRLLSNRGKVVVNGKLFPVVGRVCMDQILIDLENNRTIREGDEAVLFGRQGAAEFSVREICGLLNTIPYEVCCWVSKRVPRHYQGD